MKTLISLSLIALCSCAWWKANSGVLLSDAQAETECVISGAQASHTVETIAVDCGIEAVEDVVSILDTAAVKPVPSPALAAVRAKQAAISSAAKQVQPAPSADK